MVDHYRLEQGSHGRLASERAALTETESPGPLSSRQFIDVPPELPPRPGRRLGVGHLTGKPPRKPPPQRARHLLRARRRRIGHPCTLEPKAKLAPSRRAPRSKKQ